MSPPEIAMCGIAIEPINVWPKPSFNGAVNGTRLQRLSVEGYKRAPARMSDSSRFFQPIAELYQSVCGHHSDKFECQLVVTKQHSRGILGRRIGDERIPSLQRANDGI